MSKRRKGSGCGTAGTTGASEPEILSLNPTIGLFQIQMLANCNCRKDENKERDLTLFQLIQIIEKEKMNIGELREQSRRQRKRKKLGKKGEE